MRSERVIRFIAGAALYGLVMPVGTKNLEVAGGILTSSLRDQARRDA